MTQLVLKLSEKGEETTIIIPEVELTKSFRTSIASALTSLVNAASAKIVEDAVLNAPLPALPCLGDEELSCCCEVEPAHLLAILPDLDGKSSGKSRGGPKTLSEKVRFSVLNIYKAMCQLLQVNSDTWSQGLDRTQIILFVQISEFSLPKHCSNFLLSESFAKKVSMSEGSGHAFHLH